MYVINEISEAMHLKSSSISHGYARVLNIEYDDKFRYFEGDLYQKHRLT